MDLFSPGNYHFFGGEKVLATNRYNCINIIEISYRGARVTKSFSFSFLAVLLIVE